MKLRTSTCFYGCFRLSDAGSRNYETLTPTDPKHFERCRLLRKYPLLKTFFKVLMYRTESEDIRPSQGPAKYPFIETKIKMNEKKKKKKTSGDIRDSVNGGEANACQICLDNKPDKLKASLL